VYSHRQMSLLVCVCALAALLPAASSVGAAKGRVSHRAGGAVDPVTALPTGDCTQNSGGVSDSFETNFSSPGGLNPNLCGAVNPTLRGDNGSKRGTWVDNTSSYSGVPTNCIQQGTTPAPGDGSHAVMIHANAGTGGSVAQDCIWMSSWRYISYPSDVYYGMLWYFPSGSYNDPSGGAHDEISEFNWHPFINAGPLGYSVFGDTMQFYVSTGAWQRTGLAQYSNGARYENGQAGSNMGPVSNWRIIPKGSLVRDKWIETIVHVHYANDSSGAIQSWYRLKGQSTWNETINQSGFPTIDWGPDSGQNFTWTPNNENGVTTMDHLGVYRTGDTNAPNTTFWIDNYQRQPTFNAVASTTP
jgi:hypothetical protein